MSVEVLFITTPPAAPFPPRHAADRNAGGLEDDFVQASGARMTPPSQGKALLPDRELILHKPYFSSDFTNLIWRLEWLPCFAHPRKSSERR
jgi:hypothetical protein